MCYALSMKLKVFPNSQMPQTTKLRECKTRQLSWHLRCSYLLFPLWASFIRTVLHTPRAKNRSCILCSCFILFIRAKKDNKLHCDAVTPFPLSLIHSNGGCVADKTFSNQFLGINNHPSRAFLKLQSIWCQTIQRCWTFVFVLGTEWSCRTV